MDLRSFITKLPLNASFIKDSLRRGHGTPNSCNTCALRISAKETPRVLEVTEEFKARKAGAVRIREPDAWENGRGHKMSLCILAEKEFIHGGAKCSQWVPDIECNVSDAIDIRLARRMECLTLVILGLTVAGLFIAICF